MQRRIRYKVAALAIVIACLGYLSYELVAVRGTFVPHSPPSQATGSPVAADNHGNRTEGRLYLVGAPNPKAPLVVVLHGDAPFAKPGYQYRFASKLASAVPGTRVAALLRPGYEDPYGARSSGDRGFAVGENYTAAEVGMLTDAIESLKAQWMAPDVVLIGHSGGAALAADIASFQPGLVSHVYLISCPCDVTAFRRHMAQMQWGPLWLLPTKSISPIVALEQLHSDVKVTAISGSDDLVTLPDYARDYVARARQLGISASMILIEGKGHEILNDPEVLADIATDLRGAP